MESVERRGKRSSSCSEAIRLQLEACVSRASLGAMVLADSDGLCLGFAGPGYPKEELAANMTLLGRKVENFEGAMSSTEGQWNVRIRRFNVDGVPLYLGAVGGGGEARAQQLHQSVTGVRRILQQSTSV